VASIDRQVLLNNLLVLAKAAKIFGVPVVLTAVESKEFKGDLLPELLELFPGETPIERSTMNSWDKCGFRDSGEEDRPPKPCYRGALD